MEIGFVSLRMKHLIFLFLSIYLQLAVAQKPAIDSNVIANWKSVAEESISNDGKFISYRINNQPSGSSTLIIRSTTGNWVREFNGASRPIFSADSRIIVFKTYGDSLALLALGHDSTTWLVGINEYQVVSASHDSRLIYRTGLFKGGIVVRALNNSKEFRCPSVRQYAFADNGGYMLLQTEDIGASGAEMKLNRVDLSTGKMNCIWVAHDSQRPLNYAFSPDGQQLAFIVEETVNKQEKYELWRYGPEVDSALRVTIAQASDIDSRLELANWRPQFSNNDSLVLLLLKTRAPKEGSEGGAKVDIWSYTDQELQSLQLEKRGYGSYYKAIFNIGTGKIIRLEQDNEQMVGWNGDFALVMHRIGIHDELESYWNLAARSSYSLVSTRDGSRRVLRTGISNPDGCLFMSPGGKWVIYFDFRLRSYFSYETATGITRNITATVHTAWVNEERDKLGNGDKLSWLPFQKTWLGNDEAILIYDSYDIWQIDPAGLKPAVNITNGYGRKHHIKFEWLDEGNSDALKTISLSKQPTLFLKAVNKTNKMRGFFSKKLGTPGEPDQLCMGPFVYGQWEGVGTSLNQPIRAKEKGIYLVLRMSAVEAPNLFVTENFREFNALSSVQPQKEFNWMTASLMQWKAFDGELLQGILYKPENFDPNRSYPIIFTYYEDRSEELNLFLQPGLARGRINIPWFVSNGYLVFVPDIKYKRGNPGRSAYNCVVSAAKFLTAMKWIDPRKMGLQGHSFGGYETEFIITHTGIFSAACSSSGFCDLISWFTCGFRGGYSMKWAEKEQGRMGSSIWQIRDSYINNSPIFWADRITTPLLLMNNKDDRIVPFQQGVEFFSALRRLGKKAWMLQYDHQDHSLDEDADARDYSIRMFQFFNHYLKGDPAPKWMTRGLMAELKGVDSGMEFDRAIRTPGPGLNRAKAIK